MKNIVIIGAGLMVKPIVDYFLEQSGYRVSLVDQVLDKAINIKANRDLCTAIEWSNNNTEQLDNIIKTADIVISMVPKPIHLFIAESCLKYKKNMLN